MTLVSLLVTLEAMKPFTKTLHLIIDRYRQAEIVICTGLGAWEQDGLPSFYKLKEAFDHKNIPAWFAEWGHDVAHDWEWWRKQMPYFLGQMHL